jgi:orotate phosphoribosyltransferase
MNMNGELRDELVLRAIGHGAFEFNAEGFLLNGNLRAPYYFRSAKLFGTTSGTYTTARAFASMLKTMEIITPGVVLFGTSYKGMLLIGAIVATFAHEEFAHSPDIEIAYCKKGSQKVKGELQGKKVVIIDDTVSSGNTMQKVIRVVRKNGGTVAGAGIILDRQEALHEGISAVKTIRSEYSIPVGSIITTADVIRVIGSSDFPAGEGDRCPFTLARRHIAAVLAHQEQHGGGT